MRIPIAPAAALLLLLTSSLKAATTASIYYFDEDYRISFDMSEAVDGFANSAGAVKLENVYNTITHTNGARFVLEAPDKLTPAELERTTDYELEDRQDIFAADNSILVPPRELLEAFAESLKNAKNPYSGVERLPAEILSATSPSGLKFKVLYIPSRREKSLWEPTCKMEHRLLLDGIKLAFISIAVPGGLNGPSNGLVEEASNKDTNVLLGLAPGSLLDGDGAPDAGPGPMLDYLAAAGTDIAALNLPDLKDFQRWDQAGAVLSSGTVDFICSNVKISTPALAGAIKPYAVRRIAGVKVGFIALVPYTPAALAELSGSPFALWNPKDEDALGALVSELREKEKVDVIAAVSFYRREDFGWLMSAKGIDVVIGPKNWESAGARKTRVEIMNWQKEEHSGPAIPVFPDSSGSGQINLDFSRKGKLTAVEMLPGTEDGTEPFYYREKTAIRERMIRRLLGSGDALLPDPRHMTLRGKAPALTYAIPDFFNLAASLLRKRLKAEISVLRITPIGSNVLGDTPASFIKIWLGPDEPVQLALVPGSVIKSFLKKQPPRINSSAYYSPLSYQGNEYYALSGLDDSGRVGGLPLTDSELYLTALPASLLQGRPDIQRVRGPDTTVHGLITGALRELKTWAPTREAWESAVRTEILNLPESRDIWRLNLRNLSLQMVNTTVSGARGYTAVNESRLSAVDQTRIQGSGRLFSEYYSGKFRMDTGVSADYGKEVLHPAGQPRVTVESVDQLVGETELRYRMRSYNGGLGPLVLGPFASAAYDTEFSRVPGLPLRQILRGKAGMKMFEGTSLQELYAGLTTEQIYTYKPTRNQYGVETGFRLAWPVPGTGLTLNADGNYRNFARSRFDSVYDLKERLELNMNLSARLYGDIKINPFVNFLRASGKKLSGSASNLTTGFTLEYSRLFKIKN